jgi:hypothetical protein
MDNTLQSPPNRRAAIINFVVAITMSVLGNAVYSLLAHGSPYLPPLDAKLIGVITLASFLAVILYVALKNYRRLKEARAKIAEFEAERGKLNEQLGQLTAERSKQASYEELLSRLGVRELNVSGWEPTIDAINDAEESYWWLGMSGFYVICSPFNQVRVIEQKPQIDFVFVTVDPDCSSVVTEQATWQHREVDEICSRLIDVKNSIDRLAKKGVNIVWECHSSLPTFRVVIVDKKKVLVSFYEKGKLGPEGEQLELDAGGLLGRWFVQFFEKARADAKRMRILRKAASILAGSKPLNSDHLVQELHKTFPDEDVSTIRRFVGEL